MPDDDVVELAESVLDERTTDEERDRAFRGIGEYGLERFLEEARRLDGGPAALAVILSTALSLQQQASSTAQQFGLDEAVVTDIGLRIDELLAAGRALEAGQLTFSWLSLALATFSTVADDASGDVKQQALAVARTLADELDPLVGYFGTAVAEGDPEEQLQR